MSRRKGIWIGLVVVLLLAALFGGTYVVNRVVRVRFDRELARLESTVEVRYGSLWFEFWSGRVRVGNVSATLANRQLKLLADSLLVRDWKRDVATGVVVRMGITGKGVRIHRRGENGGWIPQLNGYGYEDPKLGVEMDYQYQPESRALVLDHLKVGGREMGALSLQGRFTDAAAVDWGRLGEGLMMQRLAALGSVKIAGLQMQYDDFGLLPRVFAQQASASNKTPAEIAEGVYGVIEGQKSLRLTPAMLDSIHKFLKEPNRIELVMQPTKPVGTMEWITALLFRGDLVKLLGLDIRT
jgi:hypothetical protein